MLPLSSPFLLASQFSASATFPGENGKIAFSRFADGNFAIYVMDADGSNPTRLTARDASNQYPDWSPDGEKIAFSSAEYTGGIYKDFEIHVMDADGTREINISNNPAGDFDPSWSPDGTNIAFVSNRDGNEEIYVMDADGSNPTRLTNEYATDYYPDWSPDGEKIAFSSYRGGVNNYDIWVMNADGSEQTRLTTDTGSEYGASWSPDGTKIAFYRDESNGRSQIHVINADGSERRNLSNNAADEAQPSWSPDGTKIAFHSNRDQAVGEIYVMDADGSNPTRLTNNPSGSYFPDWGTAASSEEDTTPPVITVPDDITEEATSADGAVVSFEVSAEDDVDEAVDVNCDYDSGDTFPIGETDVTCIAEDTAGNRAEESFTITVQDTTPPDVEITQAVDRSGREITDGSGRTPIPYIRITFEATDAVGIDNMECSLDGQAFTSCTSPVVYDRLSRTSHEVTVRATDEAGNTGEDEFNWTVGAPPSNSGSGAGMRQTPNSNN